MDILGIIISTLAKKYASELGLDANNLPKDYTFALDYSDNECILQYADQIKSKPLTESVKEQLLSNDISSLYLEVRNNKTHILNYKPFGVKKS